MSVLVIIAVASAAALVIAAKSPSPSPVQTETPKNSPVPKPIPLASPADQSIAMIIKPLANAGPPPKPVLYLMNQQPFSAGGKNYIRLLYEVLNKGDYPAEMFAAAPTLPPCGLNPNASRTRVYFFDAAGNRIYGFCALGSPQDLGKIWIAYEEGTIPPSYFISS